MPRVLRVAAWAGALWLAAGASGCRKASRAPTPPSLANLALSPAAAARDDGSGSLPVQFEVELADAGADATDLVITVVDGAAGALTRVTRKLEGAGGQPKRTVRGTIRVPTTAVARHAVRIQALDAGGSASNVVEAGFDVVNPLPVVAALSPSSSLAGAPAFTLTVTGTGFVASSNVVWNAADLPTTFVDASTLTAAVTADAVTAPVTAQIQVRNPSPGGGLSAPAALPVTVPGPATYALSCPMPQSTGFGPLAIAPLGALPFVPLGSLREVPNPVIPRDPAGARLLREDLAPYVADLPAAIQLGKALYWDVQAGSDDATACATCHQQAGADVRRTNQLHPGPNGLWDARGATSYGTNFTLSAADFPFTDPLAQRELDDVVGSQGVRRASFAGVDDAGVESTTPVVDPVFGTTRQATALHAPTSLNAVFNLRNFHNGRAEPVFNGVSPFGGRDAGARVWNVVDPLGAVAPIAVSIPGASLASQAVGPPLNPTEMSAVGRTFPELGRKLLLRKPLARQAVSPKDSVLGPLADPTAKGLATTYAALVRRAFQPRWWDSATTVAIGGRTYSLMQANFSLFWGLAVMLYEATLVSDDSPMDRYAASRVFDVATATLVSDDPAQLDPVVNRLAAEGIVIPAVGGGTRPVTRADILAGLDLFEKPLPLPSEVGLPAGTGLGCSLCHAGSETTSASVRKSTTGIDVSSRAFERGHFDLRLERMFMGVRTPAPAPPRPPPPVPPGTEAIVFDSGTYSLEVTSVGGVAVPPQPVRIAAYDTGWYNLGVRPTADDLGLGGVGPDGLPLSLARLAQQTLPDPSVLRIPGGDLGCATPGGAPLVPPAAPMASPFAGDVLLPGTTYPLIGGGLRKTEPIAVDGSFKTSSLRNVELSGPYFHNGGKATLRQVIEFYDAGGDFANETVPPLMRPLGLTEDQANALVAFLVSLTDERVRYERAPFDHPELPLPSGQDAGGADVVRTLPAVGADGAAAPLGRFLGLNPFAP